MSNNHHRANIEVFVNTISWALFAAIFIFSIWACFDIGQSWDEGIERLTLSKNIAAIQGLLHGNTFNYQQLIQYGDRYYGIGFHLPALLLSNLLGYLLPINNSQAQIGFTHIGVFLCFIGSSLLVRAILLRMTLDKNIAAIGMVMYLLWPYLWGHSLMNVKDMPFLFSWLICTYFALIYFFPSSANPVRNRIYFPKILIPMAIATGWLLSIRISGVLIFIEYGCFFISASIFNKSNELKNIFHSHLREIFQALFLFLSITAISLLALYPISWHNPREVFNAINYMSHHPWDGTTLTAGRFIAPGNQVGLYLFVWLIAKTPLLLLIGIAFSPWMLYKEISQNQSNQEKWSRPLAQWVGIAATVVTIIVALIIKRVGLYNEARQVLFLFPLIFILGISSLFIISKRICYTGILITCTLFIWDNLTLYPYNYSYVNEIARHRPAIQYFETDYFGISAGRSARWINANPNVTEGKCIYAYPTHLLSYELDKARHSCLIDSAGNAQNLNTDTANLLFITQRNLINFPIPTSCHLVHSEERTLPLSKNQLVMGKIFICNPN